MARFRKKPVEVEAVHWGGGAYAAGPVIEWIMRQGGTARYHEPGERVTGPGRGMTTLGEYLAIDTLEGTMRANPDDWIIKGVHGEFYPCKPDIFAETYELVEIEETGS